ncbi:MAG TPA: DegQ family serine endoprotease [Gammaproteobacteria bacterium]|nr:DegQ family serine endoprotease [Gammaproteobacteria bacterium]
MKKIPGCTFILALFMLVAGEALAALPAVDSGGTALPTLAPMLEKATPAVVNIATRGRVRVRENPLFNDPFFRHFFDLPQRPRERLTQSLGSGVVVDAGKGYILTNNHVIEKADEIEVTLRDGRKLKAELVGSDPATDIAVIKVKRDGLTALPLADSDRLRVGDFVVAIGNPFGLGQTVTSGIVSALGRTGLGIEGYEDFIQTDASINPGNSGGALVNLRGELVGINTAIFSQSGGNIGIGFAIPINMAREVMQQLIEHGRVERGVLGVQVQDLTPELARAFAIPNRRGVVISAVVPGSAAEKAGLKTGDIIVAVNGRPVEDSADVRNRIGLIRVGSRVELKILRDGKERIVHATIGEEQHAEMRGEELHPYLEGAVLGEIGENSPLYERVKGVVVTDVDPGSRAWQAGLRKGDVITSANRRPVGSLKQLRKAIKGQDTLLLNVQRGNSALFLLLR